MDPRFWQGRRVLITGHTGFKGGWLSMWLDKADATLAGYALPPSTRPSFFEDVRLGARMKSIHGDVRDLRALKAAIRGFHPEVVLHLAAQPLVLESYRDPVRTYEVNVLGTVNVLEACRGAKGLRVILNVTTDKVYANRESRRGYTEEQRLGGVDPYSNSKACSELATAAYVSSFFPPSAHRSHGVAVATARSGNVIGGGDWASDRLVPDLVRAFLAGRKARIRHPGAVRPWQHVLEPLHGYLLLAERLWRDGPRFGGAWNFGPSAWQVRSVGQVVKLFARCWGKDAPGWVADKGPHPHETGVLRLSSAKAARLLGRRPSLSIEEAVRLTSDWYRARAGRGDAAAITLGQIERFEHCVARRH